MIMTDAYIKIDNITKAFGEKQVLCGVTLEMERNESAVIIGRSGCGKSVLLKHIMGILKPEEGKIFIDDKEIPSAFSDAELEKEWNLVKRDFFLKV